MITLSTLPLLYGAGIFAAVIAASYLTKQGF